MKKYTYTIELLNIEKYSLIKRIKELDRFEEYEHPYFGVAQERMSGLRRHLLEIEEVLFKIEEDDKCYESTE